MRNVYKAKNEVKHFTFFQKILIIIIVLLLILGVFLKVGQSNFLAENGYDTFSMLRYNLIEGPIRSVKNTIENFNDLSEAKQQNELLKKQISRTPMYKAKLDDAQRRVNELEKLMDLDSDSDYKTEYANVINRDLSNWNNIVSIDKGSNDGIKKDNVVLCSEGVIGKVIEAHRSLSKVQLLSAPDLEGGVSIKVQLSKNKSTEGILEGYDQKKEAYVVKIFNSNAKVKKKMEVVTSGQGKVYPSGLYIGKITEIYNSYDVAGKTVYVKPCTEFDNFDYVAVLKGKE